MPTQRILGRRLKRGISVLDVYALSFLKNKPKILHRLKQEHLC